MIRMRMIVLFSVVFLLIVPGQVGTQSAEEVNSAIVRVRQYLLRSGRQSTQDGTLWLENSGKIGVGYDIARGSPICYTGQCQMEGFRQSVFKLDMTQQPVGSCASKLIPQNVEIQCLPSIQTTANTESISTVEQLSESIKNGIDISVGVSIFDQSFSYRHSRETRSMIDTLYKRNSTVFFTRATITWVRLTAFVPLLQLSDKFTHVIDKMPCCNESSELSQYIREHIIDYFGLMYVRDLLLGGVAQQKIVVSEDERQQLQKNGFSTTNEAEMKLSAASIFAVSTKLGFTQDVDRTKVDNFKKYSQQSSVTTLGGTPSMQSIEDWSRTVPANPTIVKFGIAPLLGLLTEARFPNDSRIRAKRDLIQREQIKYMSDPIFCYNNCSQRGLCVPSEYFGFGQCQCQTGWTGIDCSRAVVIPQGRLVPLYRYGRGTYDHFYTTDPNEMGTTTVGQTAHGNYISEGDAGRIFHPSGPRPSSTVPFYRYVSTISAPTPTNSFGSGTFSIFGAVLPYTGPKGPQHFYTTGWEEVGTNVPGVVVGTWKSEGIVGFIYPTIQNNTLPLYRYYYSQYGAYFYTTDPNEIGAVTAGAIGHHGYRCEGIAGYVMPSN